MDEKKFLADQFESHRKHLQGVAYRMLGSLSEADDAVQEAWLRLSRSDASDVENLRGWLTTVVARVALDMLRSRRARAEEPADDATANVPSPAPDPEKESLLADSVGLALLVVLEHLAPAERLAFVLHDIFAVPFEEIAPIVDRTPDAARQLASRARRRVQGTPIVAEAELGRQREAVSAILKALRSGDFDAIVAALHPDVVVHGDDGRTIRGAANWARNAVAFSRAAKALHATQAALVDGAPGVILAPRGKLARALRFGFADGRIAEIEIISDAARVAALEVAVL